MTVPVTGLLWCLMASLASAAASTLIKFSHAGAEGWTMARLGWLAAACGSYGLGFVFYVLALQRLPMSLAYPWMVALTILMVAVTGNLLLHEPLSGSQILGMVLIATGALVLLRGN